MSIYNFTDREHETLPDNVQFNHLNSNGHRINGNQPAAGYNQMESDFMNRNFTSSNPPESSHQLTRPTSKTALLVRQRRAMLEQLSCSICKGYLIDATTINECMDSFCKSCIVIHLRSHNSCPKCGLVIPHLNPLEAIKPDKILQDIIYKLVPGLYDVEMKHRRDFYRNYYEVPSFRDEDDDDVDDDSCSSSIIVQGNSLTGEQFGIVPLPKPFYKPSDSIDLSIEPQTKGGKTTIYYDNKRQSIVTRFTGSLRQGDNSNDSGSLFSSVDSQLFKTYLRCPGKLTVLQLKKFIASKYNIFRDDTIYLLYLNESLKDEYSLIDVAYIYDWRALEHMQLFYIVERDLTKVSTRDSNPDSETRFGKLNRQSVGISTQTVKRVCIDPQPKFYEEKNNNSVVINDVGGRSMRSRTEAQTGPVTKASQIIRKNPIIHTTSNNNSSQERKNYSIQVNGTRDSHRKTNQIITRQAVSSVSEQNGVHSDRSVTVNNNQFRALRNNSDTTRTNDSSHGHSQVPKLTLNLSKPNSNYIIRSEQSLPGQNQDRTISVTSQNNSRSQIVPFMNGATIASTTQSSVMTLASFSGSAQSKIITSISASSTSVQTLVNPQRGLVQNSSDISHRQSQQSGTNSEYRVSSRPQLALKFVRQEGTTLVFPPNNNVTASNSSNSNAISGHSSSSSSSSANHTAPARPSNSNNQIINRLQSGSNNTCTSSTNLNLISSEAMQSTSSNDDTLSQRHNLKVKPVYKTFVDPTKLKSPNLKKLGFTARH